MNKILVVDDDADIRDAIQRILETRKYDVQTAPDADEALAKLSEEHFDIVILDIMMPGMNVSDFVDLATDTPFIYCSALPKKEAYLRTNPEAPNVIGYIQKPFDMDYLLKQVQVGLS